MGTDLRGSPAIKSSFTKENRQHLPAIKKEITSSPPPLSDNFNDDMDFDIDAIDDEPDQKSALPSSPTNFKSNQISDEDDDELVPTALNAGKRTALFNKRSIEVKTEIKKEIKQEIKQEIKSPIKPSPQLQVPAPVEEVPDASEWLDINSALPYEAAADFQNIKRVSLDDATDDEGNMLFFWTDFKEIGDSLALFGKVKAPSGQYVSAFLFIRSSKRELYFLPRKNKVVNGVETDEPVEISDVYEEIDKLMSSRGVKEFASKPEERKYCFEIADVPREATYLKVLYNYDRKAAFPMDLQGMTFSHVFGTNTNIFENFVLSREVMGPCWLKVSNVSPINNVSWCNLEAEVPSPASITVVPESEAPPPPPMNFLTFSIRTIMNRKLNRQEIVAISGRVHNNLDHDTTIPPEKLSSILFTLVRPVNNSVFPLGFEREIEHQSKGKQTITTFKSEEALLSEFLNRVQKFDPDVLVGHSLENIHFNILAHRLKEKNIQGWSRLGRIRQSHWPSSFSKAGSMYWQRNIVAGRLMCDISNTFGKSLTLKCNSWTLTEMCDVYLSQARFDQPIDCSLSKWIQDAPGLFQFISHNEADTYFISSIALKLQMMALSKQLTNLAGNSWARTLSGTRAERNEYILLHQFYKQGYIVPDKGGNQIKAKSGNKHDDIDEELDNDNSVGTKKKDKYKGGLVFEPEKGLYDHIILVMDFNSLYPSIIQEYNICFTTVERQLSNEQHRGDEEEQVPEVPDGSVPLGIFPRLVQNLVQRRRAVKSNMKDPKATPVQLAQWDIKQQALKLTANSMYGCLGFTKSRFYARPLAVLTTFKGREILTNTKELAEANGLKVIYGDTDSVMINTNVDVYDEAIKTGNDFKRQVNERYRLLEIDIDNVFRRMLLHAKKKYAAVNMSVSKDGQIKTSIEVKGLDMKRREYCDLSKEASQYALNQILGDMPSEEALEHIHEYLRELSTRLRENQVPLVKLIIRNKLGKHPKDYPQGHTMPHVQVAKRRIEKGEIVKIDDVIAYIIAADSIPEDDTEGGSAPASKHVADRAYTLAEFKAAPGGPMKPDVEYYLTRQILPPLERLCAPIEGTDAIRLADCLGLDTEKYKQSHISRENGSNSSGLELSTFQTTIDDAERFRYAAQLRLRCALCECVFSYTGLTTMGENHTTAEGIRCDQCRRTLPMTMVNAQLEAQIRQQIASYYAARVVCAECRVVTRQVGVYGRKCVSPTCHGGLVSYEYSDLRMYNQLLYYDSLFDVDRAKRLAAATSGSNAPGIKTEVADDDHDKRLTALEVDVLAEQNRLRFQVPRRVVDKYLSRCGRRYVDMKNIFGFM